MRRSIIRDNKAAMEMEDGKLYRYAMAMAIHILRVIHYGEQQDLAASGGFARSQISDWEKEKKSPDPDNVENLAKAFGVGPRELLRLAKLCQVALTVHFQPTDPATSSLADVSLLLVAPQPEPGRDEVRFSLIESGIPLDEPEWEELVERIRHHLDYAARQRSEAGQRGRTGDSLD